MFLPARLQLNSKWGVVFMYKSLHENLLAFPTKGTKYWFYLRCLYAYVSDSVFPFIRAFATSGEKHLRKQYNYLFQYSKDIALVKDREAFVT